jgi:hypothetical protein
MASFAITENEILAFSEKLTGEIWQVKTFFERDLTAAREMDTEGYKFAAFYTLKAWGFEYPNYRDLNTVEGRIWNEGLALERESLREAISRIIEDSKG